MPLVRSTIFLVNGAKPGLFMCILKTDRNKLVNTQDNFILTGILSKSEVGLAGSNQPTGNVETTWQSSALVNSPSMNNGATARSPVTARGNQNLEMDAVSSPLVSGFNYEIYSISPVRMIVRVNYDKNDR